MRADGRLVAFAPGSDQLRVQFGFALCPTSDDPAYIAVIITAFEHQPVRIGFIVTVGDLVPDRHAQIGIQRLVFAAAIFGVIQKPFEANLFRPQPFHRGNVTARERVVAARDIDGTVVFAVFDDHVAIGIHLEQVMLASAPTLFLGAFGDIQIDLARRDRAILARDLDCEIQGTGRIGTGQNERQRIVRIDRDIAEIRN